MLQSTIEINEIRRTVADASKPRYCSDALSIPSISQAVCGTFSPRLASQSWAKIALLLLEHQMLDPSTQLSNPEQIVRKGMAQWANELCGDLDNLGTLSMICLLDHEDAHLGTEGKFPEGDQKNSWYWGFEGDGCDIFRMKEKLGSLEQAVPGLGETALDALEIASGHTWEVFTPVYARNNVASYSWWNGETTDAEFIETFENETGEDFDHEDVTMPSDFDGRHEPWVVNSKAKLSNDELQLLSTHSDPHVVAVAEKITSIRQLLEAGTEFPDLCESEHQSAYLGAVLEWQENDYVLELYDEHINSANQCSDGYTTWLGIGAIPYDSLEFREWKRKAENGLRLLRLVNDLIPLIADSVTR